MALYTKIKGEVGYTVVGNPTIENGIVSNFSNSNYLKSAQAPTNITSYEIQLKFKTTAFNNRRVIGDSTTNCHSIQLEVPASNETTVWYGHPSSSHGWQGIQGRNAISVDTWYWFKAIWTGTKVTTYISTNGKKWLEDGSCTTSTCGWDQAVAFGYDQGNTLTGSIDLNECYIKINGQVWFGNYNYKVKVRNGSDEYIIVGSPIINQYEMTNLSSSNYITTKLSYTHISTFDINIKCKLPSTDFGSKIPIVVSFGNKIILGLNTSRKVYALYNNGSQGINGRTALSLNSIYYLKYTLDENKIAKVYFSTDGENYTLEGSVTLNDTNYNAIYSNSSKFQIGAWSYGHSYDSVDTIYLDKSNIIMNNKLIWNGIHQNINAWKIQQDNFSKYYTIVDGKLMWANPNIYLQTDGNSYIKIPYKINSRTTFDIKVYCPDNGNNTWFFGAGITYMKSCMILYEYTDNTTYFYYRSSYVDGAEDTNSGTRTSVRKNNGNPLIYRSYIKNNKYFLDVIENGITYSKTSTGWTIPEDLGHSINYTGLFASFNSDTSILSPHKSGVKIYNCKLYDNSRFIHNFVPVPKGLLIGNFVVPSNGMFDIVEQKFYGNQGTGEFEIGGIHEDYIIEGSKLLWCNPNIYLQSDGGKYIDTEVKPTNLTTIEGRVMLTTINKCIYGSRTSKSDSDIHDWIVNTATTNFPQFGSDDSSITYSWDLNQIYAIKNGQNGAYINNSLVRNYNTYTFTSTWNMYLFGLNQAGSLESRSLMGRIYDFQIKENDKLIRYFLPVNTGMTINSFTIPAPGMWDAVTKKFYPNKGTGTFTYGKDE